VATTVGVSLKRLLILVTGTRYQDQLDEISYRIRGLDPDLMSGERFDEQVRRLRAGRDRLKAQPFQVAVNTSPQDRQAWLLVSWPGIHAPSNLLPQPGQSSGECSVILIPGRSSPLPAGRGRRGSGCRNRLAYHPVSGFRCSADPLACMKLFCRKVSIRLRSAPVTVGPAARRRNARPSASTYYLGCGWPSGPRSKM
jgi:hypothetical protein